MIRVACVMVSLASLSACATKVEFPQYEAVSGFVKQIIDSQKASVDEREFLWTARLGDEGRLLRVHQDQGLFIFASTENDAVAFDGWHIRSFAGFGTRGIFRLVGSGPTYQLVSGSRRTTIQCEAWLNTLGEDEGTTWSQQCETLAPNIIRLDAKGKIIEIRQSVTASGEQLVLEKLPPLMTPAT